MENTHNLQNQSSTSLTQAKDQTKVPQGYRYIKIDEYTFRYKDTTTSEKFGGKKLQYECVNKLCDCYLHMSVNFAFTEFFCEEATKKPTILEIPDNKKRCKTIYDKIDNTKIYFFGKHLSSCEKNNFSFLNPKEISSISNSFDVLRCAILKEPLKSSYYFFDLMVRLNQKFNLTQIKYQLKCIRGELFPKDLDVLIQSGGCLTKDPLEVKKQSFCPAKMQAPYIPRRNSKRYRSIPEFVILASNYMLGLLSSNGLWFLDGTFKIAPRKYYQMLTILIFDEK